MVFAAPTVVQSGDDKVSRFGRRRHGGAYCFISRISPTSMTSGACRRQARRSGNVAFGIKLISRWLTIAFLFGEDTQLLLKRL
jgi:hypothetical protein